MEGLRIHASAIRQQARKNRKASAEAKAFPTTTPEAKELSLDLQEDDDERKQRE